MTKISEVIGWKFNHQEGMNTKAGEITDFPGGIPSQADQDKWTAEYEARDKTVEMRKGKDPDLIKIIEDLEARVLSLEKP